jgi:hypothetical protein
MKQYADRQCQPIWRRECLAVETFQHGQIPNCWDPAMGQNTIIAAPVTIAGKCLPVLSCRQRAQIKTPIAYDTAEQSGQKKLNGIAVQACPRYSSQRLLCQN